MSQAWFTEQLAPGGNPTDGCHPTEAAALKTYLEHELTAPEAAIAITKYTLSSPNPVDHIPVLWGLLINALIELPSSHLPALITLLEAIQALPEPDLKGQPTRDVDGKLWSGLPGFGHDWADLHKPEWVPWRENLRDVRGEERVKRREEWVKKAEVEAELCERSVGGIPLDWGYECLADGLERGDAVLDFEIPALEKWIKVAGGRLYRGVVEGEESWALERVRGRGLEEGRKMTGRRWGSWRERLEGFSTGGGENAIEDDSEKVVRESAKAALEDMKKAEADYGGSS